MVLCKEWEKKSKKRARTANDTSSDSNTHSTLDSLPSTPTQAQTQTQPRITEFINKQSKMDTLISKIDKMDEKTDTNFRQFDTKFDKIIGELEYLKATVTKLASENNSLVKQQAIQKDDIDLLRRENNELKETINNLEQWTRRPNIRIFGLSDSNNETAEDSEIIVKDMCASKLKIDLKVDDIEVAHRIGRYVAGRIRPVIVKLASRKTKDQIIKMRKALKGTRVVIAEDLTRANARLYTLCRNSMDYTDVWTRNGTVRAKTRDGRIVNPTRLDPTPPPPNSMTLTSTPTHKGNVVQEFRSTPA